MRKGIVTAVPAMTIATGDYAIDTFGQVLVVEDAVEQIRINSMGDGQMGCLVGMLRHRDNPIKNPFIKGISEMSILAVVETETFTEKQLVPTGRPIEETDGEEEMVEVDVDRTEVTTTPLDKEYYDFASTYVLGKEISYSITDTGTARIGDLAENMAKALEILNNLPEGEKLRFIANFHDKIKK